MVKRPRVIPGKSKNTVRGATVAECKYLGTSCPQPVYMLKRASECHRRYGISACPTDALALTNRLVVHPADFPEEVEYVRVKGKYILGIVRDNTGSLPPKTIGPSKPIRMWVGLSMQGEQVEVEVYQPQNGDWAGNIDLEVSTCCATNLQRFFGRQCVI